MDDDLQVIRDALAAGTSAAFFHIACEPDRIARLLKRLEDAERELSRRSGGNVAASWGSEADLERWAREEREGPSEDAKRLRAIMGNYGSAPAPFPALPAASAESPAASPR